MKCLIYPANLFGLIYSLILLGMGQSAMAGSLPVTLANPQPGAFNNYYGTSTAITPDGSIAVVGANAGGYGLGTPPAVYIFQYAKGAWSTAPLITLCDPAAGAGCNNEAAPTDDFGTALAVSSISNNNFIVAVGAPGGGVVNSATVSYGLVYIYQCTLGGTAACTQVAKLPDPGITGSDAFGSALAVSSDGATLLVGAWGSNEPGGNGTDDNNEGAVYVYTASNGTWITAPRTTLLDPAPTCASFGTPPNQQSVCDEFGYAVSLAGTGNNITALIGAPGAAVSNNGILEPGEGVAFFFGSNSNGAWQPLTKVTDPNTAACSDVIYLRCDEFGYAVALAANGNAAAVAAPNATVTTAPFGEAGAVSVISQASAGGWGGGASVGCTYTNSNQNMNTIYSGIGGFGWSLAFSSDGSTLTVGMPEGAEGTNNGGYGGTGEVDVFDGLPQTQCSNTPAQISLDPPVVQNPGGSSPADFFGGAVAMSGDTSVTLVGAPDTAGPAPGSAGNNGLAYVYGAPAGQTPVALSLSVSGPNNVSVSPGEFLDYALTITNTSNSEAAINVTLTATLAPGVNLVGDSSGGAVCTANGNTYSCTLASLAAGASWQPSITLSIASSDSGIIITVASLAVTAKNGGNSPSATEIVTVSSTATTLSLYYQPLFSGLVAEFSGGCSVYNGQNFCSSATVCTNVPGSNCPMLIEVRNNSSAPADNVGLIITIPAGMTVTNVNAGQGSCFVFAGTGSGGSLWCGLGTLAPKSVWVVWYYYLVNSTDTNGQTENSQATAAATNMGSVSQPYNFTVGTPTTVVSTSTNSGSVSPLEIALLFGLAWCVRRRLRKQQ